MENRESIYILDSVDFRFSILQKKRDKVTFLFTKLDVYNNAVDLAEKITSLTEGFPKGRGYLCDQLNRAVLSISLNIAEGNGRFSDKERQNFFRIARGSAFEYIPILEICRRKEHINKDTHKELIEQLERICKMLSGLIKSRKSL